MNTSKDTSLLQAFVLTERDVGKLHDALMQFSPDVRIEIKCADGLSRTMPNLDDLLKFENPLSK